jgi:hypothetical protein
MTTSKIRTLCLVLVAIALAVVAPVAAPAQAGVSDPLDTLVLVDHVNDVWQFYPGEDPGRLIGARPTVDITRARVWYHDGTLGMRLRFVNLRRTTHQELLQAVVRTSETTFVAYQDIGPGNRSGTHRLTRESRGVPVRCPGMQHRVSYRNDVIVLRTPATCLDQPEWVRAQIYEMLWMPARPGFSPSSLVDNPFNARGGSPFSPRLYGG